MGAFLVCRKWHVSTQFFTMLLDGIAYLLTRYL